MSRPRGRRRIAHIVLGVLLAVHLLAFGGYTQLQRQSHHLQLFLDAHVAVGFGELVSSLVGVLLFVLFARFLYQRKIFLRL